MTAGDVQICFWLMANFGVLLMIASRLEKIYRALSDKDSARPLKAGE